MYIGLVTHKADSKRDNFIDVRSFPVRTTLAVLLLSQTSQLALITARESIAVAASGEGEPLTRLRVAVEVPVISNCQ